GGDELSWHSVPDITGEHRAARDRVGGDESPAAAGGAGGRGGGGDGARGGRDEDSALGREGGGARGGQLAAAGVSVHRLSSRGQALVPPMHDEDNTRPGWAGGES